MLIKEFAQQTNLPAKTIRYYEEIGLLPPPKRLANGYRDYTEVDVTRARFVAGARSLDFPLDDIQEILDLRECLINRSESLTKRIWNNLRCLMSLTADKNTQSTPH